MAFRPTLTRFASTGWLARQARDPYVKQRAAVGGAVDLRSRSAFKLLEMNDQFKFLDHSDVLSVVDLGAAPGGWSQLLSSKMGWSEEFSADPVSRAKKEPRVFAEGDKYGRDKLAAGAGAKPLKWWQSEDDVPEYEEEEPVKFETRSRSKRRQLLMGSPGLGKSSRAGPVKWDPEGEETKPPTPEEAAKLRVFRRRNGERVNEIPEPPPPKGSDPLDIFREGSEDTQLRGRGTILAVDLLRMAPIPGVITMQLDFLKPQSSTLVHATMAKNNSEGKVDVILSDMASNFSGNPVHDVEASLMISEAVWQFTKRNLRTSKDIGRKRGGVLLLKHFTHPHLDEFRIKHLEPHFAEVRFIKPKASRAESGEGYWLCSGWKGVESLTFGLKDRY